MVVVVIKVVVVIIIIIIAMITVIIITLSSNVIGLKTMYFLLIGFRSCNRTVCNRTIR